MNDARMMLSRCVERVEGRIVMLKAISRRYSLWRLTILIVGVVVTYAAFQIGGDITGWIVVALSVAVFLLTANAHSNVERSIRRHAGWLRIRRAHLARLDHDWEKIPTPREEPIEPDHPFERDLNLTGMRSLHHLIDTANSVDGSRRLRSWLTEQRPDPSRTLERQALVRELIPMQLFRDRLMLNGALIGAGGSEQWEGDRLLAWLEDESSERSLRPSLLLLSVLAAINLILITLGALELTPQLWPASLILYGAVYLFRRGDFAELFEDAFHLELSLQRLRGVFVYLEQRPLGNAPRLADLLTPIRTQPNPSLLLRSIGRIANAASFQHNPLARLLLNAAVPWDLYFAHRLNLSKGRLRQRLPQWLDCWHELEALSSLANVGWLHAEFVMPELVVADESSPLLEAYDVGHPLLRDDVRVANDFTVDRTGWLGIVTGSNMSGKSTFLRSLGVNLSLAYAGGPVCATRFHVQPMRVFTCINVSDSVNDGISYFYAEVRRLKALLDALRADDAMPLFFLIDEIYRGTNNRERLIGARAFMLSLVGGNGSGLISTHDLELVHLSEESSDIANYHFRESIESGRMIFDYALRSGPSPTTNALEIMKMEGLPVGDGEGRRAEDRGG